MESLRKVQVEPSKMEILNDMVSDEMTRALENDYYVEAIEGIVATATAWGGHNQKESICYFYIIHIHPKELNGKI